MVRPVCSLSFLLRIPSFPASQLHSTHFTLTSFSCYAFSTFTAIFYSIKVAPETLGNTKLGLGVNDKRENKSQTETKEGNKARKGTSKKNKEQEKKNKKKKKKKKRRRRIHKQTMPRFYQKSGTE